MTIIRAYLGLGSNLGNRFQTLEKAICLLGNHSHIEIIQVAGYYETEPVAVESKPGDSSPVPWFLNTALALDTSLKPKELLSVCADIEIALGRCRQSTVSGFPATPKVYASRTLDIDILLYGQNILDKPDLKIPHPRMHERAFVLVPLLELAPDEQHPRWKQSIRQLYEALRTVEPIKRFKIPNHLC